MATLIDSYTTAENRLEIGYNWRVVAQSFLNPTEITLDSAQFRLRREKDTVTGDVFAKLYAHSGTFGTSSVGASVTPLATSDAVDSTTLPLDPTTETIITFDFSGDDRITLSESTHYVIGVYWEYDPEDQWTGIDYLSDSLDGDHAGNLCRINGGGTSWSTYPTQELVFWVYGSTATDVTVIADLNTNTINNPEPVIAGSAVDTPDALALTVATYEPSILLTSVISADIGAMIINNPEPTINVGWTTPGDLISLTIATHEPTVNFGSVVSADINTLTMTVHEPTILIDTVVAAVDVVNLTISTLTPQVITTDISGKRISNLIANVIEV